MHKRCACDEYTELHGAEYLWWTRDASWSQVRWGAGRGCGGGSRIFGVQEGCMQGASRPQVGWGRARRCGGGSYISGVQAGCVEAIGEVGSR